MTFHMQIIKKAHVFTKFLIHPRQGFLLGKPVDRKPALKNSSVSSAFQRFCRTLI